MATSRLANSQNRFSGFDLFMVFTSPFNFGGSIADIVISDSTDKLFS
jgi:hypothetical protein